MIGALWGYRFVRSSRKTHNDDAKTGALYRTSELDFALARSNLKQCFLFIQEGRGLLYSDVMGNSVLHTAAIRRSFFMEALVCRGLNPNAPNDMKETPLHVGLSSRYEPEIMSSDIEIIKHLNVSDPDLVLLKSRILKHMIDSTDCIRILLEHGSNPNARMIDGKTPLIVGVRHVVPLQELEILLRFGADIKIKDKSEKNALDWAKYTGYEECVFYFERVLTLSILVVPLLLGRSKKSCINVLKLDVIRRLAVYL